MKTRYLKVTNETATPLPDKLQDIATHSLSLSNEQYDLYTNADYFKVVDGEPFAKTQDELDAMYAEKEAAAELNNIENLHSMCEIYQNKTGGCNGNFFAMLTAVRGVAKSTGQPIPAKAQACLDWLDSLWGIYYTRKAAKDWNHDFSAAGTIPHSFTEVREESEQ